METTVHKVSEIIIQLALEQQDKADTIADPATAEAAGEVAEILRQTAKITLASASSAVKRFTSATKKEMTK